VQPSSRDIRAFYAVARGRLKHALLEFDQCEMLEIAGAIGRAIEEHRYACYALAVLRDPVHMVIRKHRHLAEDMIENLQSASRDELRRGSSRDAEHPVWGGSGWKVFLDTPADIRRTIEYVETNPVTIGRAK